MYPVLSNTFRNQRNLIDTLFGDDFFTATSVIDDYSVRTNVATTNEEYRIDVVAPGLDKNDMNVKIEDNQLSISYDNENTDKTERVYYRSFSRFWKLPADADFTTIRADYKQGILSVFVPREIPASESITIDIK
jgi:HSP20 family protein|tara:strand:- start:710 stop:1111 length:402 start_codon:yes stop_codon:yes gene_type:complete